VDISFKDDVTDILLLGVSLPVFEEWFTLVLKGELAVWFGRGWVWMWAGAGQLLVLLLLLLPVAPILTQAPLVLRIHLQKGTYMEKWLVKWWDIWPPILFHGVWSIFSYDLALFKQMIIFF
jgi:hypothetical protein